MTIRSDKRLFTAVFALLILSSPVHADVIAATTFDGRALAQVNIANDTASGLNWTLNGVQDPGGMTVLNAAGNGLALFDGNSLVKNMFAPALNTGNGNTFWTTTVALTVIPGSVVSLTDVTFDYWAVSGSQVQNVTRRSDFTISLLSPTGGVLASVDVVDASNSSTLNAGVGTPVSVPFDAPISLTEPGTYILRIKGGDFLPADETGNHTAIDNLSINGTFSSNFMFTITAVAFSPDGAPEPTVTLTWTSRPGVFYAVRATTDLSEWPIELDDSAEGAADSETTTRTYSVSGLDKDGKLFLRVEE